MSESDCSEPRRRRSSRTLPQTKKPDPLICPRCQSTNTKFCYYNNYNKTQPRYFCKACKRHWTRGGILRNVPVGGGRKNKRLRWPEIAAAAAAGNQETCKASFFTPISGEKNEDESYTDIDELKGLVSWDLYGSLIGCTVPEFVLDQDPPFSILLSSFDANPNSNNIQKSLMSWNDLESMGLEDLNKPWEDPTFKT